MEEKSKAKVDIKQELQKHLDFISNKIGGIPNKRRIYLNMSIDTEEGISSVMLTVQGDSNIDWDIYKSTKRIEGEEFEFLAKK